MYNSSGSLGRLDVMLLPYYEADTKAGQADRRGSCLPHRMPLGARHSLHPTWRSGTGRQGSHQPRLFPDSGSGASARIPANIGVCVGKRRDPRLMRRGVENLLEDRAGVPKFLGVDNTVEGFAANGFPLGVSSRSRLRRLPLAGDSGARVCAHGHRQGQFRRYLRSCTPRNVGRRSRRAQRRGTVGAISAASAFCDGHSGQGIRFPVRAHSQSIPGTGARSALPGTIEKGLDASNGGVEYYTFGVDGAALATAADSFAAVEERRRETAALTWEELRAHLESNWAGSEGERARIMMKNSPRFGNGGSLGDEWAVRVSQAFTETVKEKPTPRGFMMIPGLFSWVLNLSMGRKIGATPNGRHAGDPISHGANPDPGFRKDGAPTALAVAVASVQPGYGNASPLQIDLDPSLTNTSEDVDKVLALIRGHCELGGTQVNINVLNNQQVLEAHQDPSKFPDLIVRVTGFSAYFASLSPEMRQFVVDRILCEH